MDKHLRHLIILTLVTMNMASFAQKRSSTYHEPYRPQIHFSPPAQWMNDPNGLVYYNGVYNLFYQYYPQATVWGPMHWGHATSRDLVHWKNQPIALYPDSLGLIFSGSAVVDYNNTSGFGKNGKPPLVAIFTQHNQAKENDGKNDTENESIAYSNDGGLTWTKYQHNPVIKNPGERDFRDPKVTWYAAQKKWVMTLATGDRVTFYSSKDLKSWTKESEFGQEQGAHGGVWECPDLFPMKADGKTVWIFIVNINPGGPNGGSATQYFVGDFDGSKFTSHDKEIRWLDYGPDEYAGVTWSNTGDRRLFLGWMSNWQYATVVPTKVWRSATTVPRQLQLMKIDSGYYVNSSPVAELNKLKSLSKKIFATSKTYTRKIDGQFELDISLGKLENFSATLSNTMGEKLVIGYDSTMRNWYIDRTHAGQSAFYKGFARKFFAPRISKTKNADVKLIGDVASTELFADKGLTVMTSIFFPQQPYTDLTINIGTSAQAIVSYSSLKHIWP